MAQATAPILDSTWAAEWYVCIHGRYWQISGLPLGATSAPQAGSSFVDDLGNRKGQP
jgi:hypothetical protein